MKLSSRLPRSFSEGAPFAAYRELTIAALADLLPRLVGNASVALVTSTDCDLPWRSPLAFPQSQTLPESTMGHDVHSPLNGERERERERKKRPGQLLDLKSVHSWFTTNPSDDAQTRAPRESHTLFPRVLLYKPRVACVNAALYAWFRGKKSNRHQQVGASHPKLHAVPIGVKDRRGCAASDRIDFEWVKTGVWDRGCDGACSGKATGHVLSRVRLNSRPCLNWVLENELGVTSLENRNLHRVPVVGGQVAAVAESPERARGRIQRTARRGFSD